MSVANNVNRGIPRFWRDMFKPRKTRKLSAGHVQGLLQLMPNPLLPDAPSPTPQQFTTSQQSAYASLLGAFAGVGVPATKITGLQAFPASYPYASVFGPPPDTAGLQQKVDALKAIEPRKVGQRIPDLVEVVTGWRAWNVYMTTDDELALMALGQNVPWRPKEKLTAICCALDMGKSHRHASMAPEKNCTCGVWAFKSVDKLVAALGDYHHAAAPLLGKVSLWGKVIETENGWRAQYAYPSELWLLDPSMEELGFTYGVPIRTL